MDGIQRTIAERGVVRGNQGGNEIDPLTGLVCLDNPIQRPIITVSRLIKRSSDT